MQIEQMGVLVAPELGGQAQERAAGGETEDPLNMRVVAEEGNVLPFREYGDAGPGMRAPDCPQEWRGEKNVTDGAEANRKDVRRGGRVGHGQKLQS